MFEGLPTYLEQVYQDSKVVLDNIQDNITNPLTTLPAPSDSGYSKFWQSFTAYGISVFLIFLISLIYLGSSYTTIWQKFTFAIIAVTTTQSILMFKK